MRHDYTDEYLELCADARDALREVIDRTEAGTGWHLRAAHRDLVSLIERQERGAQPRPGIREQTAEPGDEPTWPWTSTTEHEQQVLAALGDEQLTLGALWNRLKERDRAQWAGRFDALAAFIAGLVAADEVRRAPAHPRSRVRRRYFRNRELSGAIAELQRAFDAAGG